MKSDRINYLVVGAFVKVFRFTAVEPELQAFYDSLDAEQKKAFDTGGRIGGIFDWWGKK